MTTTPTETPRSGESLQDQLVVVIGGSAGIGLETARLAHACGAEVILTGRNTERLQAAATDIGARSTAAFDATDWDRLDEFFGGLPKPVDHVLVTAGSSHYATLADLDFEQARQDVDEHLFLTLRVARLAVGTVRPGGALLFMSGTGARRPGLGLTIPGFLSTGTPTLIADLALEIAPIRVNLIAPGFVDTPLSAQILGDQLEARRADLRRTLPIGRVVGPEDVAALAVHLMTNTALTGATYDIDGGQQLTPRG